MPFIMISAGPTSSRLRTVSLPVVVVASGLLIATLLTAGAALGHWLSSVSVAPVHALPEKPNSAMPFAVEQLGALSGRLFKLENQAGQLSERIGAMQSVATKPSAAAARAAKKAESGGPLLPPRAEPALAALGDLGALRARLAQVEQQIGLVADAASLQNLALMRLPTRLPIENAELGSAFGNREDPFTGRQAFHSGLDFAAGSGTVIHAAAGGTVAFAGFKSDYGWVVEIEHGNGLVTRYAHASRLTVKAGAVVMPGDPIAAVGSTGRSTGPHLHFEVLRDGEAIDPRRYLAGL